MGEMIERVAEAIRGEISESDVIATWVHRENAVRAARAAIEAMREPTEPMLRASPVVGTEPDERGNWAVNTKPAQAVWPAMIDAALSE